MLRFKSYINKPSYQKHLESFKSDIFLSNVHIYEVGKLLLCHSIISIDKEAEKRGYNPEYNETVQHILNYNNGNDLTSIIRRFRKKFRYHCEWEDFRRDIKQSFSESKRKEWEEVLPDKVALWASRRLRTLKERYGDNCTDNYRVAKVGNTMQEKRYRRYLKKGCCGFFDCIDICPIDGHAYRLGFNYGH